MPPARAWVADRPGDEVAAGQPHGRLFGTPGPNIGYAATLAHRLGDRLALGPGEHLEDALAVVSELAMKRAASFGRAPVLADLDVAALILGYLGGCDPDDALVAGRSHRRCRPRLPDPTGGRATRSTSPACAAPPRTSAETPASCEPSSAPPGGPATPEPAPAPP